jgi:hypothetical protein
MIVILLILFLLFLLYPKEMFLYGDSILGKLIAVSIIVYLTYENVIHGLFACICLIWFYQSDILAKHKLETETEPFTELAPAPIVEKSLYKKTFSSFVSLDFSKLYMEGKNYKKSGLFYFR